jgi:surface antigen
MHRRHHSPNRAPLGAAIGIALTLAACAPATRPDPPGFLGALIDRPPPAVQVKASSPYGNPLGEPVSPIIRANIADEIVAATLRPSLSAAARMSLAEASERAAAATTGATVLWQSADAVGAVVPARDPYRSHRGEICRDLQQQMQNASGPMIDQVTLCHHDLGDGRILWLPGSPD